MLNNFFNRSIAFIFTFAVIISVAGVTSVFAAPPSNDNFADAQVIGGIQVHVAGTNAEATTETGEPNLPFATTGNSVWYKYTPVKSRYYSIRTTRDTNFDTYLGLYNGTEMGNLFLSGANNNVLYPATGSAINTYLNAGTSYYIRIDGVSVNGIVAEGNFTLDIAPVQARQSSDFDRDGRTDFSVFRPSNGTWYVARSVHNNSSFIYENWGMDGDIPVATDFDGNFRTDAAVFRPSNGTWYIKSNGGIPPYSIQFGQAGDIPVPGQYFSEGDMMAAVFRPSNGTWYFCNNNDYSVAAAIQFGQAGDVPVPGDYDLDGKTDVAVFRPSDGTWYILSTENGFRAVQFGLAGDKPVLADYDGDAIMDVAVFRPSDATWYVLRSSDNQLQAAQFGIATDIPSVGDYNGDGKADYAVFRPADGAWYVARPTGVPAQNFEAFKFGQAGDIPVTKNALQ
jgi:hypothetical protein